MTEQLSEVANHSVPGSVLGRVVADLAAQPEQCIHMLGHDHCRDQTACSVSFDQVLRLQCVLRRSRCKVVVWHKCRALTTHVMLEVGDLCRQGDARHVVPVREATNHACCAYL